MGIFSIKTLNLRIFKNSKLLYLLPESDSFVFINTFCHSLETMETSLGSFTGTANIFSYWL